jgi:hypothetical protein
MAASLSGVYSTQQFTDAGLPASGYRLYTYSYGTTTLKTAYTDAAGSVAHTYTSDGIGGSYIALNARGELPAPLYLTTGSYDLCLKTPAGATVWTRRADPISDAAASVSADLASSASGKGAALVANIYNGTGSAALNLHEYIEDDGSYNVMGFIDPSLKSAIRDRTSGADVSAQIMTAQAAVLSARGGGRIKMPAGKYNVGSPIIGVNGVGITGEGSLATLINVTSTNNAIQYGDGTTQFQGTILEGFAVIGTTTSGIGIWGRIFTDSCVIRDVYVKGGSTGIKLDNCYSLGLEDVRVRSALNNGIECNAITHNTSLRRVKVQVCGNFGLYTIGCYTLVVRDSNFEFNAKDQINIASGRGITLDDVYVEGIPPTAGGYAGVQIVAADTVNIHGGLYDATQVVASPVDDFGRALPARDGTGTYVKVSGASSRVRFRDYGFVSVAATQTHANFGATALNCEATVPLGATFANAAASCRVYNDDFDERGVVVYNTAVQAYTFGAWNGLAVDTVSVDAKSEWAANQFTPKDYGVYDWDVCVGIAALGAGKDCQVRLLNVTDSFQIAEAISFTNTGAAATSQVFSAHFKELLSPLKAYQVQLFNNDVANRNSINGASVARQTIKRIK